MVIYNILFKKLKIYIFSLIQQKFLSKNFFFDIIAHLNW